MGKNEVTKPNKLQQVTDAVRAKEAGEAMTVTPDDVGELVPPPTAEAMSEIVTVSPAELASFVARALAEEGATMAPVMLTLEVGQSISGTLQRGPGATLTKQDTRTGEPYLEEVPNWIITTKGKARFALLETSQLATQLPPYDGGFVTIIRGEDFNVKGKRVTRYITVGKESPKQRQMIPVVTGDTDK